MLVVAALSVVHQHNRIVSFSRCVERCVRDCVRCKMSCKCLSEAELQQIADEMSVTDAKLQIGVMVIRESNSHVIVEKWKDKRDVLFLTTESIPKMTDVHTKRSAVQKLSTIVQYNKTKSFIGISDQKASYSSAVRRGIKWYRKWQLNSLQILQL